jgi:hypothetical protein
MEEQRQAQALIDQKVEQELKKIQAKKDLEKQAEIEAMREKHQAMEEEKLKIK